MMDLQVEKETDILSMNQRPDQSCMADSSPVLTKSSIEPQDSGRQLPRYIKGWRLHIIVISLCLALFLTNLEIPIVTTSIVGITDDLQGFNESSWLATAYLLTYVGFLIIWAKLSDIFGRKLFSAVAALIFVVCSGACGAAQSMTQLIVLRALQGIGGAGIYAVDMAIFFDLVPPEEFPTYASLVSVVYAISLLLGPILGGLINDAGAWRWVFLLNVPSGLVAIALLLLCLPNAFPHHHQPNSELRKLKATLTVKTFRKVDFTGSVLLLTATVLLVAALEEAGTRFSWRSPFVIILLIASGLLWMVFLTWERHVTKAESHIHREPVFPFRFIESRVWVGMMLNAFFLGAPFFVAIFQIPQRSQIVNGVAPLMAGVRLLPFSVASPIGSIISSMAAGKLKIPPIYLILPASLLQVLGFALLSTLPTSSETSKAQYGYEAIAGFGCGVNISLMMLLTPHSIEKRDQAVALGTIAQFRVMGGAIGLAIVTSVLNSYVGSGLLAMLTPEQVKILLQTTSAITSLPVDVQDGVQQVFAKGYNIQFKILACFAAAQIPSSLIMWKKKQIVV
ncbi:MAG: hypothetical protein Q9166_007920 [cf. Caloplaca sp. 2 TL-2023]